MIEGKIKIFGKIALLLSLSITLFFFSLAFQTSHEEIFKAAAEGSLAKVQELVEKDPELIKARDGEECSPLHRASEAGHIDIVKYLLSRGADIDSRNNANQSPLLYAAFRGKPAIVSLLLEKGADFRALDRYGRTVLHYPVREGHKDVVEILVKKGMSITVEDGMGVSPLRFAIERGHAEIMDIFVTSKSLDVGSDSGRLALHLAAAQGQKEIADLLIAKGASTTTKDDMGATLLHNAATGGLPELSRRLIEDGALLNEPDARGRTPLHNAVKRGSFEIVKLLVEEGADLNVQGKDERTALHIAEDWGFEEISDLLKAKGAEMVPRLAPKNPEMPWVGITYISNDGFMIASESKKILVDGLIKNPWGYSNTPDKVFENMIKARSPFDRIDLLLFSHAHRDHFEPQMALEVLMAHPETILVGNEIVYKELKEAAGEDFSKISAQVKNINPEWGTIIQETVNGVDLKIFPVNHSTQERPYVTLAYIMDMDKTTVLHLGDIYPASNEEYFRTFQLQNLDIAVAFIDPFFLLDETGQKMVKEFIQPQHIILMHMRDYEVGRYASLVKNNFKNFHVFWEILEKKIFEDF